MSENDRTLEEMHRDEQRTCPECKYPVLNPLTDRCPRCFAMVPRVETNCGSCTHQGNCEFVHLTQHTKLGNQ
jgi:hypothetical protein